jgi:hypothetical protein
MNNVAAKGPGKSAPVAGNSTAADRKLNRRVEMVVSGEVIGSQLAPSTEPNAEPRASSPENPQTVKPQYECGASNGAGLFYWSVALL